VAAATILTRRVVDGPLTGHRRSPNGAAATVGPGPRGRDPQGPIPRGSWIDHLRPLRFDHWIKNLVVPIGSLLALAARGSMPGPSEAAAILSAFVVSGLVSSVNYAINEVVDAPFDAAHPTKRHRPIPSGQVRVAGVLALTATVGLLAAALAWWTLPLVVLGAVGTLFVAALAYNLPPARLKDVPYLDTVTESVTNPIRLAIGWYAVAPTEPPPGLLLVTVWCFGAFLMTGKRLAELRLLGDLAALYRPAFRAYSVGRLGCVQLAYALVGMGTLAALLLERRPAVLIGLPLVGGLLGWAFRMTFEPESPLVDPEHLYRRPVFLLCAVLVLAVLIALAVR
jgi:4-hydroxybenzoate polyprenyltransferase